MQPLAKALRICTDEGAFFGDRRLYEVIANRARDAKLAGATVYRALLGFGHSAHVHTHRVLDDDQSVIIEIIDEEQRLRGFVRTLADLPDIGLVTLEQVEVLHPGAPENAGEV